MESLQQFDLILMNRMEATSPSKSGLTSSDEHIYGDFFPFSDGTDGQEFIVYALMLIISIFFISNLIRSSTQR